MISVLSAEAAKLLRHRATWFLVWIYPLGMIAVFFIALMLDFFGAGEVPDDPPSAEGWVRDTAVVWQLATSNFGRFLIAAYAAVAIAGEYGWNTWKLIVPHRARRTLLGSKLVTVFALLYLGLGLAGLLTAGLSWAEDRLTGESIPDGVTVGAALEMQGVAALATLLPMLFTLAYASLAAVLTRSMVATLVIAIVVGTAEQLFTAYAGIFYPSAPGLISALYHLLPGYHLANSIEWIVEGQGLDVALPNAGGPLGWQTSLAVAGGWAAGLIAITLWRFQRQDIN